MATLGVIALVIFLVGLRLLMPPVPDLLSRFAPRWGKRSTLALCAISLALAVAAICLSRRPL